MSFETYMIIGDGMTVRGDSTPPGLVPPSGWMEIGSFSWGASNPATIGAGGLSAGKVSISSFSVTKRSEDASVLLFAACCAGQPFATASVVMRQAVAAGGAEPPIFLRYDFRDVLVESIQWSGSSGGDSAPTDSISFAFAAVAITHTNIDASGRPTVGSEASWDLTRESMAPRGGVGVGE